MIRVKKHLPEITIKPGDEIDFITVEWIEPCWQFDNPSALIYPVFKVYESSRDHEQILEDVLIDISTFNGHIESDSEIWRCNPRYLKRIASEILNDNFRRPNTISQYRAEIERHRFYFDEKENCIMSRQVDI